jgi:signal transduction histidine kinase
VTRVAHLGDSDRVAAARSQADRRLLRQRATLRPLGLATIAAIVIATLNAHPTPAGHGKGLGVAIALVVFVAGLWLVIAERFPSLRYREQGLVLAAIAAAGVALGALQPHGATQIAASIAVFMTVARLPGLPGAVLGGATVVALAVSTALAGSSAASVVASILLCLLLAFVAYFIRQARESQDRTELLMAALEDAQEAQAKAAAVAERGRIAGELHDVLAHALSGAAIQLQGARMLADRSQSDPQLRTAIDRAAELVRDGLANARQAVGALRGEELPGVGQIERLVESFRADMHLDASLTVEGEARPLPADASLALYRGVQEALTNVARYAPGAGTSVVLRFGAGRTIVSVENERAGGEPGEGLSGVGGGRGLAGMRERIERSGGAMQAGPTDRGWRVELQVPS